MFLRKKLTACLLVLPMTMLSVELAEAQSGRSAALQQAQNRGQQSVVQNPVPNQAHGRFAPRVARAQGSNSRIPAASPVINNPVGGAPVVSTPVVGGAPVMNSAPIVGGPGGAVSGGYSGGMMTGNPVVNAGPAMDAGAPMISDSYFEHGIVDEVGCCGGTGCGVGGCDFCGNRNGGCGPECWENCWIGALGGFISNAELFGGAHAFRSRNFTAGTQNVDDSSFGFYGGVNFGLPLCRLTCGLFSGQVGVRSSQSEFEGDFFSTDNRDQLFITAGLFRRVDYGMQAGVVFDYMHEEWFAETDLAQVRAELSWVYPGGSAIGFRGAIGTEDDVTNGLINGAPFGNLFAQVVDNYRIFYRMSSNNTGHCDIFAGWSDSDDAVLGIDFDMPLSGMLGMQAGFTYFLPEDTVPTTPTSTNDAWNIYVGFAIRPQGPAWYGNYDRPLFNVADNGTFVFERN